MVDLAGFDWWTLFLVFFVIGPALGWGVRSGRYWGDRHGRDRVRWRDRERVAELEAALEERTAMLEQLEGRVAELENRLDFAERLLAERRQADSVLASPAPAARLSG
jgi:hypothetical protein